MGWDSHARYIKAATQLAGMNDIEFFFPILTAGSTVAGAFYHFWQQSGGDPVANAYGTGSNAYVAVSGNDGSPTHNTIARTNPTGGKTRHLVYSELQGSSTGMDGILSYHDVIGYYPDFNLATGGTQSTGTAVGGVDIDRHTSGKEVFMFLETQVVFAGTMPTIVINYTDQGGVAGATASLTLITGSVASRIGTTTYYRIPLASGDIGLKSVQSVVFTGGVGPTGKFAIVLARKLGNQYINSADAAYSEKSFVQPYGAYLFPQIQDDSVIGMTYRSLDVQATPGVYGHIWTAEGA